MSPTADAPVHSPLSSTVSTSTSTPASTSLPSTPPRRPQRSTLRLSVHNSSTFSIPSSDPLSTPDDTFSSHRTSQISPSPDVTTPSRPPTWRNDSDVVVSSPVEYESSAMVRSKSVPDIPSSPTPGTPRTPGTPTVQRPATAHLSGSRGRRKPVPSMLEGADEFGNLSNLSIDTKVASQNSLGSAPLSGGSRNVTPITSTPALQQLVPQAQQQQRRVSRGASDLVAFLDDGPLPPPQRPRGPSVSSMSAMSMLSAASQSRPYTLPVDPPAHQHGDTPPPSPPSTPTPPGSSYHRHNGSQNSHPASATASINSHAPFFGGLPRYSTVELQASVNGDGSLHRDTSTPALAFGVEPDMQERLPRYEQKPRTEPITLAASLWRWGFFFFPFWIIGMFM